MTSEEPLPLPPAPPRRLTNVFASSPSVEKVYCTISEPIFRYFFRHVLAGRRGAPQNLLSVFFLKLHAECLRRNIPEVWDPSNEQLIADILADLNFSQPAAPIPKRGGSPSKRRSADRPVKPAGQSDSSDRHDGTTPGS